MKKLILILLLLFISCSKNNNVNNDFINTDCSIPIIECIINNDTVDMIVDSGAEYSLIDSKYYKNNTSFFKVIDTVETTFSGIGGVNKLESKVLGTISNLGYIVFIELNLDAVVKSMPEYNIAGLIGSDFLKSRNYIIDYKMRKIYPYEQLDSIYGKSCN